MKRALRTSSHSLRFWLLLAICIVGTAARAHASATVLVGEPFGNFGTMMPLGHTAVYFDHLCADGPLKLRNCNLGEPEGVVLARYADIKPYDWLATPVMQFLYATGDLRDVPEYATPEVLWAMRQRYRERFLRTVVPDGTEGHFYADGRARGAAMPEWWESAGMAYNRRIWAYHVTTTPRQDRQVLETMNADPNRHRYHLKATNCADFAASLMNLIYPGSIHNDRIADFGWMTPKQVVRSLSSYAGVRPELAFHVWQVPQVPGSLRRSRPVRGAAESGLKTKRYLFTLLAIQPEVPLGLSVLYLWHGRWPIGKQPADPGEPLAKSAQQPGTGVSTAGLRTKPGKPPLREADYLPNLTRPNPANQLQAKTPTTQPSGD